MYRLPTPPLLLEAFKLSLKSYVIIQVLVHPVDGKVGNLEV